MSVFFGRHAVPALGDRPIDAIDRAAVAKLHHSLAATPRQANLLLSVLSKLMGWAARRGLLFRGKSMSRDRSL